MTAQPRLTQDALQLYPHDNSGRQRVTVTAPFLAKLQRTRLS